LGSQIFPQEDVLDEIIHGAVYMQQQMLPLSPVPFCCTTLDTGAFMSCEMVDSSAVGHRFMLMIVVVVTV